MHYRYDDDISEPIVTQAEMEGALTCAGLRVPVVG